MRTMLFFTGANLDRLQFGTLSKCRVAGPSCPISRRQQKPGNFVNAAVAPGGQNGFLFGPGANFNGNNANPGNSVGKRGAAANADFDSLIDLIQSTVATDTWSDNGGGQAEIRPFPGGVLVDAGGMLKLKSPAKGGATSSELVAKRGKVPTNCLMNRAR